MKQFLFSLFTLVALPTLVLVPVVANAQTTAQSCVSLTQNLTIGSTGAEVTKLQTYLKANGYLASAPTGYFGSITALAVKNLQKQIGIIPASGYVGSVTRSAIACGAAGTPLSTITVLSPNGGESFNAGQNVLVSFSTTLLEDTRYNIGLYNSNYATSLANGLVGPGGGTQTVNVTIPRDAVGNNFILRVSKFSNCGGIVPCIQDQSNAGFTINPPVVQPQPSITFLYPIGGEKITAGSVQKIRFNAQNVPSDNLYAVVLNRGSQSIGYVTLANQNPDSADWSVSKDLAPGDDYWLYYSGRYGGPVTAGGKQIEARSGNFTITSQPVIPTSSVQVLSPNGGEAWASGQIYTVNYVAQNLLNDRVWINIDKYINGTVSNSYNITSTSSDLNRSFTFTLTPDIITALGGAGTAFKVRAWGTTNGQGLRQDSSDNYFSINTASGSGSNTSNQVVLGASCTQLLTTMSRGSTDDTSAGEVSVLQQFLETQGATFGGDYGAFGPKTEAAVKAWQATQGIDQTGIVGPLTRAAIRNVSCQ
jgi:peptidoglycan hydrolase-like protein with peptidoglycan-binding domain